MGSSLSTLVSLCTLVIHLLNGNISVLDMTVWGDYCDCSLGRVEPVLSLLPSEGF